MMCVSMNVRLYKEYYALVIYDVRDYIYYGLVENTTGDLVNFYAESKDDIESEFHKAVDDYLEFCKKIGKDHQRYN